MKLIVGFPEKLPPRKITPNPNLNPNTNLNPNQDRGQSSSKVIVRTLYPESLWSLRWSSLYNKLEDLRRKIFSPGAPSIIEASVCFCH